MMLLDHLAKAVADPACRERLGVVDEPVADSAAIAASQDVGYWVTPLFADDRLVDLWLRESRVPLQKLGM